MNPNKILSDADYRRFGYGDIKSWSGEELSQFLIWDFVNVFSRTTILGADLPESLPRDTHFLAEKYKKYLIIFDVIDWFFLRWMSFFRNNKIQRKVLCQKLKGDFITQEAQKHYSFWLIVQGKKDRLYAISNGIGYVGTTDLYQYVDNYFEDKDVKHLYKLIEKTEDKLKMIKPDYIILGLDSSPIDRAILWAAKKLGIPTIAFQHGLEDAHIPLFNCKASDYILVWGEYFKDLYIQRTARKPEDIYILGYPCPIDKNCQANGKTNFYTVCYLAQDYERYNKDFLAVKLETIKQLSLICKKLGLQFMCRPHPGDDRKMLEAKFPDILFTSKQERVEETFKKADIFISFSSTALVEAAMRSKVSVQLMNYPLQSDNFEQLGVSSKSLGNVTELESYLAKIADSPDLEEFKPRFNHDYVETKYDPSQRFLEIIKAIEKRTSK